MAGNAERTTRARGEPVSVTVVCGPHRDGCTGGRQAEGDRERRPRRRRRPCVDADGSAAFLDGEPQLVERHVGDEVGTVEDTGRSQACAELIDGADGELLDPAAPQSERVAGSELGHTATLAVAMLRRKRRRKPVGAPDGWWDESQHDRARGDQFLVREIAIGATGGEGGDGDGCHARAIATFQQHPGEDLVGVQRGEPVPRPCEQLEQLGVVERREVTDRRQVGVDRRDDVRGERREDGAEASDSPRGEEAAGRR